MRKTCVLLFWSKINSEDDYAYNILVYVFFSDCIPHIVHMLSSNMPIELLSLLPVFHLSLYIYIIQHPYIIIYVYVHIHTYLTRPRNRMF